MQLVAQVDTATGCCPPRKKWANDALQHGLEKAWELLQANTEVRNPETFAKIEETMEMIRRDHIARFPAG